MPFIRLSLVLLLLSFLKPAAQKWHKIHFTGFAQGTTYHITYYAPDSLVHQEQIDSLLAVLDQSLSLYKPGSLLQRFNESARGISADEHILRVCRKGLQTWRDTRGIFDMTIEPLTEAWGFGPHPSGAQPDSLRVQMLMSCVGSRFLEIRGTRLLKRKPCLKLDLNGIAQGYSVDVLAGFLEQHQIHNYVVELGGEIRSRGRHQPDGSPFKIGIEVPARDNRPENSGQPIVYLKEGALTTSGNYRKFRESAGKKISHLLDARTGFPVNNELISVTVYAADGLTADAYDNALMVMGLEKALHFVEKRKFLAAHFIYRRSDGSVTDTASSRFYPLFHP